jgi:hypothetical protein
MEFAKDIREMTKLRSLTIDWLVVAIASSLLITSGGCSKWGSKDKAPFCKWLDVGFTFDRNMDNCGSIKVRTQAKGTSISPDGKFGKACRFGGNAAFTINNVRVPNEGTWALWFRLDKDANLQQEMRMIDANHYRFSIVKGSLNLRFHDGKWRSYTTTDKMVPGEWVHAAIAWSQDKVAFYVNGVLVRTLPYAGTPIKPVVTAVVGARWTGSGNGFKGDIDELLMYGRSLAVEEIIALQTSGLNEAQTPEYIVSPRKEVVLELPSPEPEPVEPSAPRTAPTVKPHYRFDVSETIE